MDVKQKNVLVKWMLGCLTRCMAFWMPHLKAYACDFGISSVISSDQDTQTKSPTPIRKPYCAPNSMRSYTSIRQITFLSVAYLRRLSPFIIIQ